ncbi:MAG: DNA-directed polymerase subunit beta, partial [Deltaproteobacteria bacterium]|nr:DNA-directed polymerase subunit beta [Deltaproteobacteria bacterium]
PFVYNRLIRKGFATTIKNAKKLVEKERPEVWDVLEEAIKEHPVLLNRAPTLHRLGIQAFEPLLIDGKAIQLHPLVCPAYNADFDGDQMAVHIPLSIEAQSEARVLMMSTNNILSPANGRPIIVPTQDIVLGLYYLTIERKYKPGEGKKFSDPEEVMVAYDSGEVDLHAGVYVRMDGAMVRTTPGRILLREVMPAEIPFEEINRTMDKKSIGQLVDICYRKGGEKATVILSDRLKDIGFFYATLGGISICIDDMKIPEKKEQLINKAYAEVKVVQNQYSEGLITDGERYNKVIDIWADVTERIADELMKELGSEKIKAPGGKSEYQESLNPMFMMAHSGARGNAQQIRQLAGMRGLMAKPSGEIIETPITSNFREGLTVLQYFISTSGARKGLADTALKTANSGYLTRRLVDVAHDVIVAEEDCGTVDGIEVTALMEGGEVIEQLGTRILGRVSLEDMWDPDKEEIIVKRNEEIREEHLSKIDTASLDKVKIRSVLTCRSKRGVCALCYGRDLARGRLVSIGEAVGIIAAQSIGEPGTQLTMRTFHIGGAASRRVEQSTLEARNDGIVRFHNVKAVENKDGQYVVMNRNGEVAIVDETGRERERYPVIYGAKLRVKAGSKVLGPSKTKTEGQILAEWDPYTMPILSEVSGKVKFGDIAEGATMQERVDEVTGLAFKVIIEPRDPDLRPRISIKDDKARTIVIPGSSNPARYILPVGAHIVVNEGDDLHAGDVIAKMPRETTKTKDITGGLPRVAELFEARRPKESAIVSEITGTVSSGKGSKGKREIVVTPEGQGHEREARKYSIPRGKHIIVHEGDHVRAGEALMEGSVNPHDVLSILGIQELARYLVNEIQEVYQLQGVKINDKHIETIVRQMLKRVRIKDVGDTNFIIDEPVERWVFEEENAKAMEKGGRPATAEPLFLGITKASLITDSFISAASFQDTTKVLTQASIEGRVDYLRGLKENVIMGRIIPAGTGFPKYRGFEMAPIDRGEDLAESLPPGETESLSAEISE